MFSADFYVVEFVGKNWISLGLLLGLLKILAQRSKSTLDDSIFGYLGEALSGFRRQKVDIKGPKGP